MAKNWHDFALASPSGDLVLRSESFGTVGSSSKKLYVLIVYLRFSMFTLLVQTLKSWVSILGGRKNQFTQSARRKMRRTFIAMRSMVEF